jgi:hypothetical protein
VDIGPHQVLDEAIEEILPNCCQLCRFVFTSLTIPRSIELDVFPDLFKELEDFGATLLPDCPLNVWLDHLIINLNAGRLPSKDHEFLGVLFKALGLLQEHKQLHEGGFMNVVVVLYNHISD